jgi:hypothetical protein
MERRVRRWYEALKSVSVPWDAPEAEMEMRFKVGREAHYQIEARMTNLVSEQTNTFTDPSLPFDIVYHSDLFDPITMTVWDVKPAVWLANNLEYCLHQISGYHHFTGARAAGFAQYQKVDGEIQGPWFTFVPKELLTPWETLKAIALRSDEMLMAQPKATP